jgi:hypothetical protein
VPCKGIQNENQQHLGVSKSLYLTTELALAYKDFLEWSKINIKLVWPENNLKNYVDNTLKRANLFK